MTEAEAETLGKQAIEWGFEWDETAEGCLDTEGYRLIGYDDSGVVQWAGHGELTAWVEIDTETDIPDFRDDATMGCLLGQVRRVWADPAIHCAPALHRDGPAAGEIAHWHCFSSRKHAPGTETRPCGVVGKTEIAALMAALKAGKAREADDGT